MTMTFEQLQSSIEAVAKAERITKRELGTLSREILSYLVESEDVRPVKMKARVACLFRM